MNAAIVSGIPRSTVPSGLAGLAVRAGRALELWGRRRAAASVGRDDLERRIALMREAEAAATATESLRTSSGFQPLA